MESVETKPRLFVAFETATQWVGNYTQFCFSLFKETFERPFYFRLMVQQMHQLGVKSLVLVCITALATGSVLALQFGYGLARFGGKLYIPKIIALSVLREMGPVFTSLLVAGRIGSGMASEVASMKVTQQIDAIRALGTSPMKRIVIPRVIAAMVTLPILTVLADFIGLFGSMMVCAKEFGINYEFYFAKTIDTLRLYDLFTGLAKTVVFAFFISTVACWRGLNTEGGTEGVGQSTTWVVMVSSIFIMISDFFLTKFFILTVLPKY